jgi:hypothetical protein
MVVAWLAAGGPFSRWTMSGNQGRSFDISQCDNPVIRDAFHYFCRHLVCLGGTLQDLDQKGNDKGRLRSFTCSAFVLVIRDRWFLLTAGHCMKDIDKGLKNREFRLVNSWVISGFGPEVTAHPVAKEPIYFGYEETPKGYIDKDGLDFGLLDLGDYLRVHLEKNEVEPVREENWRVPLDLNFDWYIILGFPQEFVDAGDLSPTMVYLQKLDFLPADVEPTEWRRFAGRLGDNFSLKSLKGMSGGPIYGFKRNCSDRYWIPAIQSSWRKDHKIAFGCPVPLLAHLAEECLFGEQEENGST